MVTTTYSNCQHKSNWEGGEQLCATQGKEEVHQRNVSRKWKVYNSNFLFICALEPFFEELTGGIQVCKSDSLYVYMQTWPS